MGMDVIFDPKKDVELKEFTIITGKNKKGKKIAEGLMYEFRAGMSSDQLMNADRHPKKRYVVTEFKGDKGEITIRLKEINIEEFQKSIIQKLKDKINTKELLKDVLDDLSFNALKELGERVVARKGKVRSVKGCYKLQIGGKRGRPLELMLRD